ncbi:MAG: NifU family protein [Flavobacteriaceae bacterium]|nr:NifU family protein [Flavobacteriaceae bacterium]
MSTIKIENTNNSAIIKFIFDKILTQNSFEYNSIDDVDNSNLVKQLFHLPFVKKVFITANFIAIEKFDIVKWQEVQEETKGMLEDFMSQNDSIFTAKNTASVTEVFAESTPNPNVQKFVTNKLLTSQNIEVLNKDDANDVPLALELFEFPFVKEIFISDNYISIMKSEETQWFEINTEIRDFIKEYLQSDRPIVSKNYEPKSIKNLESKSEFKQTNDEISKQIIAILDEYIKPAVAGDGGNIQFLSYSKETKEVNVLLQGACNGCPSSTITLKDGIEATLKQFLPGKIRTVNALN